ncbi:uncharacterized protein LOC121397687 [Xenopus laevis]|uniref:Uncharacterized protein LOC121397687 n=1 Tax=Xenopus laevis TaxID=8355 RepID=A0A8J1LMS3_XENLA|nr:uncharacterized protein LOC121397687 [Xenopus laevis]
MIHEANLSHKTVKFTVEISETQINFLDVNLSIVEGNNITKLYRKETERNSILHAKSFHNPGTIRAIPKGQFLRAKRITTLNTDYDCSSQIMFTRFLERGYSPSELKHTIEEVAPLKREELLQSNERVKKSGNRIPFVSKYVKHSKEIEKVIKKYWPILQGDNKFGKLFMEPILFSYKKGKSIRDVLCPAVHQKERKHRFLGAPKMGTFACLNCVCCASIIKGDSIDHPTQGTKIRLHDYATCDSKGVIYMLKCPCGLVYVGQTTRSIKTRIKEHKGDIRNFKYDTYTDTAVAQHFFTEKHTHGQLKWAVLEVVQPLSRGGNFKQKMLQREVKWILKLNSLALKGLNEAWSIKCFL